jgi:hypothetical protein
MERLLDCRPAKRDVDTTSASAHPELLIGELVMRPRIHSLLAPKDQIAVPKWSHRMGGAVMLVLVAVGAWPMFHSYFDSGVAAQASEQQSDPTCITWDTRASEAIVTFVQATKYDINLKHVSDMIAQMRRARRTCQLGWLRLACQDYRIIVRGVAEVVESIPVTSFECASTIIGDLEVASEASR